MLLKKIIINEWYYNLLKAIKIKYKTKNNKYYAFDHIWLFRHQ